MKAEEVMKLYDSYWFELDILKRINSNPSPSKSESNPGFKIQEEPLKPELSRIPTRVHKRSMSDQLSSIPTFKDDSNFSPDSVLATPKLHTILSGKEVTAELEENPEKERLDYKVLRPMKKINNIGRTRRKRSESKSLSDLEFEELKGFMDLGFVFSEHDKDSSLCSIIPGLQRLGKKEEGLADESAIPRPYLSEAWEVLDRRKREENPLLMNWRIPSVSNEIDMKDNLRWWAHTVASTVR